MDVIAAYGLVGSYRGAAQICGTTHRTVKKVVTEELARMSGHPLSARKARVSNTEVVRDLVSKKVAASEGKISAKRLLPVARAAGYEGSDRNFRRLVADAKGAWRRDQSRSSGRRPAVWSPGEHLVIDWGFEFGLHVFCAVVPWSRFRFVRFAADETAATTLRMLAECFEILGGVPKVVLADRMACLKGAVVANRVIPTPDYVRFATHYRFRPDFCEAADPESKGIVEALVNYAKADLLVPLAVLGESPVTVEAANAAAIAWCAEVNAAVHRVPRHAAARNGLMTSRAKLLRRNSPPFGVGKSLPLTPTSAARASSIARSGNPSTVSSMKTCLRLPPLGSVKCGFPFTHVSCRSTLSTAPSTSSPRSAQISP